MGSGGEYNVIRGLHKCFGMNTAVITAFADNEVGLLMKDFIEQGGVSTDSSAGRRLMVSDVFAETV